MTSLDDPQSPPNHKGGEGHPVGGEERVSEGCGAALKNQQVKTERPNNDPAFEFDPDHTGLLCGARESSVNFDLSVASNSVETTAGYCRMYGEAIDPATVGYQTEEGFYSQGHVDQPLDRGLDLVPQPFEVSGGRLVGGGMTWWGPEIMCKSPTSLSLPQQISLHHLEYLNRSEEEEEVVVEEQWWRPGEGETGGGCLPPDPLIPHPHLHNIHHSGQEELLQYQLLLKLHQVSDLVTRLIVRKLTTGGGHQAVARGKY